MPNRIIKESIHTSKTVNAMTDFQFRLWINLITYVDDFGRGSADPELIKGFVFPRRKRLSETDILKGLNDLAGMGCIRLYEVDGESYFYFPNWSAHQRIQTKQSKFPEPVHGEPPCVTVSHGEPPLESEEEKEYKSESEKENVRAQHGTYRNVFLTKKQYEQLKTEFPRDYNDRINAVSAYCQSTGKAYKDYLATIRNWARRDEEKGRSANYNSSYDTGEFFDAALRRAEGKLKGGNDKNDN